MNELAQTTSATGTCQNQINDIVLLMDVLQIEINKHAGAANALSRVRSDLIQTISFISGIEKEQIEEFLAE